MEKTISSNSSKKMVNISFGEKESVHAIYKVPSGDGPYVRAKHAQVTFFFKSYIISIPLFFMLRY